MSKKFLFPVILITISSLFARTTIRPPEAKAQTQIKQKAGGPAVAQPGGKTGVLQPKTEPLLPGLSPQEKELVMHAQEENRLYQFALETFFQGKGEVKTAIDKGFEALKRAQLDLEKRVSSRRAGGYSGYGGASSGYRASPYRSSGYGGSAGYGGYSGSRGYGGSGGYGGYSGSRGYGGSSYSPSSTSGWGSTGASPRSSSSSWVPSASTDFGDKKETSPGVYGSTSDTTDKTARKNRVTSFNQDISKKLADLNREASVPDLNAVNKLLENVNKREEVIRTFDPKEKLELVNPEEESAWRKFTPQLIKSMTLGVAEIKAPVESLLDHLKTTYSEQGYTTLVQGCISDEEKIFSKELGRFGVSTIDTVPKKPSQQLTQLAERIRIFQTQNQQLKDIVSKILGPYADKPAKEQAEHAEQDGQAKAVTTTTTGPATTTPSATPDKKAKKKEKPIYETKEQRQATAAQRTEQQRVADAIVTALTALNTLDVGHTTYKTMRTRATHNLTTLTANLELRRYNILPPITGESAAWETFIGKLLEAIEKILSDVGTQKNISIDDDAIAPGKKLLSAIRNKIELRPRIDALTNAREVALERTLKIPPVSLTDTHTFDIVTHAGFWGFLGMGAHGLARRNPKNINCLDVAKKVRNLEKFGVLKSKFLKSFLAKMNEKNEYWVLV